MATIVKLLTIFIIPIYCLDMETQLDIWCQEPLKTLDLNSKTSMENLEELEYRCGIWLRHLPNKKWSSNITQLFRKPFKSKLRVLKISDGIQEVDENFFNLESRLKYLDLSGNDMDYLLMPETKMKSFWHQNIFEYLYALDLSKNKFTNITFIKIQMTNLKDLDISENKLEKIPPLSRFESLKRLFLKKNNITTLRNLDENSYIEYLDLSYNYFRELRGCEKLVNLKFLSVSYNSIQKIDSTSFEDGIWSLRDLHLDHNNISRITKDAFSYFPNLKTLKLNNNKIQTLEKGIFVDLKRLESLDISHNLISSLDADIFVTQTKLSVLNLKNNLIETLNYRYLLQICPALKIIDIVDNSFQCEFFESMMNFFLDKNIIVSESEVCLFPPYDDICCNNEVKTTTVFIENERTAMKITKEKVDTVNLKEIPFNVSNFISIMEKNSDSLLKVAVYQFVFIVSIGILALLVYTYKNCGEKDLYTDVKTSEMHKMI